MNCYKCIDKYILNEDKTKCIINNNIDIKDTDITPEISDDITEITTGEIHPIEPDISDIIESSESDHHQIETDESTDDDEYSGESM